jgi:hypothetical protein
MKRKERNTSEMSLERIWVTKDVDTLWFNHNNQHEDNSIEATIAFLKKTLDKAKEEGYEDMTVYPDYTESDGETLAEQHIRVVGERLETDEEYKRRLKNILWMSKRDKDIFELRKQYYATTDHAKRVTEVENAIEAIRVNKRKK